MNDRITDAAADAVATNRPLQDRPQLSGRTLGLAVTAVAGAGDLCILGLITHAEREPPIFVILVISAWITAQFGLLSTWLGLGGGPLWLRLLIAAPLAAVASQRLTPNGLDISTFANMTLLLVGGAVPFGLIYLLGYHLSREATTGAPADGLEKYRSRQISLRQLFGWTVAAALVASVARYSSIRLGDLLGIGLLSLGFFSICAGAVLATLLPKESSVVGAWLVLLGIATGMGTVLVMQLMGISSSTDVALTVVVAVLHVAIMSGVLLVFRAIGYRLRRRGDDLPRRREVR